MRRQTSWLAPNSTSGSALLVLSFVNEDKGLEDASGVKSRSPTCKPTISPEGWTPGLAPLNLEYFVVSVRKKRIKTENVGEKSIHSWPAAGTR